MSIEWSLKDRVRRGHRGDAKAVLEIFLAALREHGFADVEENVNSEVASFGSGRDPTQDDFVALSAGKVSGFLILTKDAEGCGELRKVFVARSHRGRGVGTLLVEASVQRAKERGYRELFLETHTAFAEARRWYERRGWTLMPHWPVEVSTTRVYSMKLLGARLAGSKPSLSRSG
jgi:GNAT superfamily N-acetyltransferase